MPNQPLPQQVTVRKLVESGAKLSGLVADVRLPRVVEVVQQISAKVEVDLHFGVDESNKMIIGVEIHGAVDLACQRCLEPVTVPLIIATTLSAFAHDSDTRTSIRAHEPIVLDEGLLNNYNMLEEEILLSLPVVALHPKVSANVSDNEISLAEHESIERRTARGLNNPIAVLKTLTTEGGQE